MEKLVLIDAGRLLERVFFGVPESMDGQGRRTNVVSGFLNVLFATLKNTQATHAIAVWETESAREELLEIRKILEEELQTRALLADSKQTIASLAATAESKGASVCVLTGNAEKTGEMPQGVQVLELSVTSEGAAVRECAVVESIPKNLPEEPATIDWEAAAIGEMLDGMDEKAQATDRGALDRIQLVREKAFAQEILLQAMQAPFVGLQVIAGACESDAAEEPCQLSFSFDGVEAFQTGEKARSEKQEAVALSLCFGETVFCILTGDGMTSKWLCDQARRLCENRGEGKRTWVLDLKSLLPLLSLPWDGPVFDAGVAGYLLNPLKDSYQYHELANDFLKLELPSKTDLFGKQDPVERVAKGEKQGVFWAGCQSFVAYSCASVFERELKQTGMQTLFEEIEMPLIYSLFAMECEGVRVEREELRQYGARLKAQIDVIEQEIYHDTGKTFNINSPRQLGEVLFEQMGLPGGKKTKTGYSTAAEVLEKLAPDYPVVQKILDYRQFTKLYSTYAEGLGSYIGADGRIHGHFNQTITATGRISSTEPNLQNIPVRTQLGREIRKVFVPKDGCVFVDADYSQIELRILAHMSADERLVAAYKEAQDIHAITASQVFHVPLPEVTPLLRRNAKAVNFGIVYGLSAFGLSEDLSISRKEAAEYIEQYFRTYPGVKTFLDGLVAQAKEQGWVSTLCGRRRPIPELKSANFNQRQFGERVAMNSPIQGTAADIMKIAMIRVDRELRKQNLKSRIVLQIHDELLVETALDEVDVVKELLETQMREAMTLLVPLEVDAKVGASWFEAK